MLRFFILNIFLFFVLSCFAETKSIRTLTLDEAILLAIRENPSVQNAQLGHVMQKYALDLERWQFKPHFSLNGKRTTSKSYSVVTDDNDIENETGTADTAGYVTSNETGADIKSEWKSSFGTKVTLSSAVNQSDGFHPEISLEVIQPLLKGFGRPIVEASLYNAIDNERVSRLNVQGALRTTITAVINAYLDVISAQNNLEIDQNALKRAEISVDQTRLFIKSGRKPGVELVTVKADVANAQTRIENDKNMLNQARQALLTAIGLNPNTPTHFTDLNVAKLIRKFPIPSLSEAKRLILENDIRYQTDLITIEGSAKRGVLTAENNSRWSLNISGFTHAGGNSETGLQSLINGVNQSNRVTVDLSIPIDDQTSKNAIANAKIALRQATIALQQEKWTIETSVINGWNSIYSAERALHFAEDAEKLQLKTYNISFQKYSHGLIDSLQLHSAQQQLIESGRALNTARMNYLKALVNMDQMIGRTLRTWKVEVKYGDANY